MPNEDNAFKNIDYKNKTISEPVPNRINDIDTEGKFYSNIIDSAENGTIDLNALGSFTSISQSRDDVYTMLDVMSEDPLIATALNIYTADACEPNEKGQIVWVEADNNRVAGMVSHLLDQINIDKNAYNWVHSLVKYGDLYLRLYRKSEYDLDIFKKNPDKLNESVDFEGCKNVVRDPEPLDEAIIVKAFKPSDHYAEYMEMHKNPAEIFDLQRFGKTSGFIRSHIISRNATNDDQILNANRNNFSYNFKQGDIDIYSALDYVHACLEDNFTRTNEEVTISNGENSETYKYSVKRGQSVLYNVFRIWRELSLLENSVMLNRITKSSIVRCINVEVGDMEKADVRSLLQRVKSMIEQKAAVNTGNSYEDYTNPGSIENTIYMATHDGTGAISVTQIGGDANSDDLKDLNYFKNKLYGALGIPKQYLGDTEDSTGFNGGSSLSLISSQYAKTVKRIQNAFIQAITDAINLMLLDRGLESYINTFRIKMQAPTTQEEKDRKDNLSTSINNIDGIMRLLEPIESTTTKLNILKSLLASTITDSAVISYIDEEIQKLEKVEAGTQNEPAETDFTDLDNFGGEPTGGSAPMEAPSEESTEETIVPSSEEPTETTSEPMTQEEPEESFESGEGSALLNEENNLPSWRELGVSYIDYNN